MAKKIALITGSTDGIGLATAKQLAEKGYHILLHGRSVERLTKAEQAIKKVEPEAMIQKYVADLSSMAGAHGLADDIQAEQEHIDVLVNNAGVYMNEKVLTEDAFEMTWAVNHLAPFLLTWWLLPVLKKSVEPRVVTVSSIAHTRGEIDFQNLNSERRFDPYAAYSNSKLANILFANELARREPWLISNSLHPGVITTKLLWEGFKTQGSTVEEGASTSVYLASSPEVKKTTGKYFVKCKESEPSKLALDESLAKRLWEVTENSLRRHL